MSELRWNLAELCRTVGWATPHLMTELRRTLRDAATFSATPQAISKLRLHPCLNYAAPDVCTTPQPSELRYRTYAAP